MAFQAEALFLSLLRLHSVDFEGQDFVIFKILAHDERMFAIGFYRPAKDICQGSSTKFESARKGLTSSFSSSFPQG
jgi:hypothetical protein